MKLLPLEGRARVLGNDINTDYIIASHRKKETIDPSLLRAYLLEDLDPEFAPSVCAGDILVAGNNFGCGSAMEVAVTVVLAAGIRAVIAKSFSRTYLRNAMNNGLLAIVADTAPVREGDAISLALNVQGQLLLDNHRDALIECDPIAPFMLEILDMGGLVPYLRQRGGFPNQVQAVSSR
jgi:3-isopropylmalate/(R)-2-methylmalate dehydratase small subunit